MKEYVWYCITFNMLIILNDRYNTKFKKGIFSTIKLDTTDIRFNETEIESSHWYFIGKL